MSSIESIATPTLPTSPRACGASESYAELRRKIEGDRKPGLSVLEQIAIARVRFRRRPEAGVLAHRPQAAAIHVGTDAARERKRARLAELVRRALDRIVDRLEWESRNQRSSISTHSVACQLV